MDPDGLLAEPAHDLGVVLRGWPEQVPAASDPVATLSGFRRRLAMGAGIDPAAI